MDAPPLPDETGRERKFINLRRDTTGLLPKHPPGPVTIRGQAGAGGRGAVDRMVERVLEPEAEIALVVGQTKVFDTRRPLTRIAISNPAVADIEVLNDQDNARTLNLYGRSFGTTTMTFWEKDKAVTYLVRVTLDTLDLEERIKQAFPGSLVHIRQVGTQVILEGQVPDAKTMSEVLQLVTAELRNSGGIRMMGGSGAGGGGSQGGGGAAAGGGSGGGAGAREHREAEAAERRWGVAERRWAAAVEGGSSGAGQATPITSSIGFTFRARDRSCSMSRSPS